MPDSPAPLITTSRWSACVGSSRANSPTPDAGRQSASSGEIAWGHSRPNPRGFYGQPSQRREPGNTEKEPKSKPDNRAKRRAGTFKTPAVRPVFLSHAVEGASVAVVLRLVRAFGLHADIFSLVRAQLRELDPDLGEMEARHLLVQRFRTHVNLLLVLACVGEQLDLRERLVGEGGRHHK